MHRGQSIIPANSAARHGTLRSPYTCTKCNQKYIVLSFQSALGIQQTPDPPPPPKNPEHGGIIATPPPLRAYNIIYEPRGAWCHLARRTFISIQDESTRRTVSHRRASHPNDRTSFAIRRSHTRTPAHTRTKAAHLSRVHADAYAGPWCIYLEVAAGERLPNLRNSEVAQPRR